MATNRIFGLDILRASAISLVLIYHACFFFDTCVKLETGRSIPDGVTVFFVLSGFLIGKILLSNDRKNILQFWQRRWLRTLPAYFIILTLLLVVRYSHNNLPAGYIRYYFFTQNIRSAPLFFTESWSLSVEEWFYLLFPVLLFVTNRKSIWIVFCIIILSTISRPFIQTQSYSEWNSFVRKVMIVRFDSIAFGVLGAYAFQYGFWKYKGLFFVTGLFLLFIPSVNHFFFGHNQFEIYFRILFESIGTLFLLPKLYDIKSGKGVIFKLITYISVVSYSLYLVNYSPFNEWILPWLTNIGSFWKLFAFLIWAFLASYVLYRMVERPFMNLRK